ncbi:MAG TPA: NADH-quinone oxidoreductase subunit J [Solirubrobacteraceae bacterium]|jgi:NADH:ubiquinone oxidoreductase subunit 6 (subunit J)
MAEVFFFIAAAGVIAGAAGTVMLRNAFYSVLALVGHLLSLAALFLLLRAEFLAAAQVVVYAGAVMVLYVFVVAYVGGMGQPLAGSGTNLRPLSVVFGVALLVEFCIAILGSTLDLLGDEGAGFFPAFGTPARMGELLLTRYLLAFEAASFLLLVAAVGAVILARRRAGLEDPRELSVADLLRSNEGGTMVDHEERGSLAEAAGPPHR